MIALLIILAALVFAAGWMSCYLNLRAARALPAATRRAIRRDRRLQRLGLADVKVGPDGMMQRLNVRPVRPAYPYPEEDDPLHGRLTDAIAKLSTEPVPDWQAGVLRRIGKERRRG